MQGQLTDSSAADRLVRQHRPLHGSASPPSQSAPCGHKAKWQAASHSVCAPCTASHGARAMPRLAQHARLRTARTTAYSATQRTRHAQLRTVRMCHTRSAPPSAHQIPASNSACAPCAASLAQHTRHAQPTHSLPPLLTSTSPYISCRRCRSASRTSSTSHPCTCARVHAGQRARSAPTACAGTGPLCALPCTTAAPAPACLSARAHALHMRGPSSTNHSTRRSRRTHAP